MSADKRDECHCHRDCTVLRHRCAVPCRWPACLTTREAAELAEFGVQEKETRP